MPAGQLVAALLFLLVMHLGIRSNTFVFSSRWICSLRCPHLVRFVFKWARIYPPTQGVCTTGLWATGVLPSNITGHLLVLVHLGIRSCTYLFLL